MSTDRRAAGFTLVELIVFIVIISAGLAGIVTTITQLTRMSTDPVAPKQAMLVAESLLEEILLKPFAPQAGGYTASCPATCDRSQFDDVFDYAGYASTGVYALDNMTTPVPGLATYQVAVSVTDATLSSAGNGVTGRRIDVTVTVRGEPYTISGYRFNDG